MLHTILVIEDDPDITRLVRADLEDAGYRVLTASTGITGLVHARTQWPDLVILDLGLPDMTGVEVARRLRRTGQVPILVLSATDTVEQKVSLLEAGVNDYLSKPYHPEELLVRIKVQLRVLSKLDEVRAGPLSLSVSKHLCRVDGREVPLSRREFELLRVLMVRPGRVVSRADITREVWPDGLASSSNVVDAHMANLREKLRKAGRPQLIRTVRGLGYALHPA